MPPGTLVDRVPLARLAFVSAREVRLRSSSFVFAALAPLLLVGASRASDSSPVGRWMTVDDHDGKPRSIVEVTETGGVLRGKITKVYERSGDTPFCTKCSGDLKDKPVLGMTILTGLKPDGDTWNGGTILDPDTGNVYSAMLRLSRSRDKLIVRGYLGLSLFGRSQTWVRETDSTRAK